MHSDIKETENRYVVVGGGREGGMGGEGREGEGWEGRGGKGKGRYSVASFPDPSQLSFACSTKKGLFVSRGESLGMRLSIQQRSSKALTNFMLVSSSEAASQILSNPNKKITHGYHLPCI